MEKESTALQLQTGPYRTTYVGTEILRPSTKPEWTNYGEILRRVDEAKQWAIGDWLVDGKRHYGDGLYKEAAAILGVDQSQLMKLKSISERFEILLRSKNLTWNHHYEVAPLKLIAENTKGNLILSDQPDYDKMQELLTQAEKEGWTVRDIRDAVSIQKRRQQEEIRLANEPEKFSVILADPAWEYDFSRSDSRQIANQYPPTSLDELKRLRPPAAEDCVLFMWATSPKIREALSLIDAWGFEYKTCACWIKDKIGMGYYFRQKHELLFVATKGTPQLPNESSRPESIFHAPRMEHSEKPVIVYELIETMYPGSRKLEMFARGERPGWMTWGDETA